MAAQGQLQFFCGRKNFRSEIIQILQSHSPRDEDVQVTFLKVLLKFKMADTHQLQFFCGRKNSKN